MRILLLVWGVVWLALICFPYLFKFPVPDESTFIYEGFRIVQGDLPYRDFFNFIMPGILYLSALVIKLTGGSILALRLTALGMLLGCMAVTLYLAKFFLPIGWRWGLGIFFVLLHLPVAIEIQHHLGSAFFAMAAVFCLWQALLMHPAIRVGWLQAAGALIGFTFLCTQTLGFLLGVTTGLYLLMYLRFYNRLAWGMVFQITVMRYALMALLPIALLFAWFLAQGALDDLWASTVSWVFQSGYAKTTSHWYALDAFTKLMSYQTLLLRDGHILLFVILMICYCALPVLALLWPVEYFVRQRLCRGSGWLSSLTLKDWRLLFLWMAGLGFFITMFSYPNTRMIAVHSWLLYLLAWMAVFNLIGRNKKWVSTFAVLGLGFALMYMGFETQKSLSLWSKPRVISYGTRERLLCSDASPDYTRAFNQLVTYLRQATPPGNTLFIYNQAPELYIAAARKNPTRYQIVMALYNNPQQIAEVVNTLETVKPPVIIYNHLDELDFQRDLRFLEARRQRFDYRLHGIEALLKREYVLSGHLQNMEVFQRRDSLNLP